MSTNNLLQHVKEEIESFDVALISRKRRNLLEVLAKEIAKSIEEDKNIALNFICTHNSRRSHLAQIWAKTISVYLGLYHIDCFSGGTATTSTAGPIIRTLQNQGFEIKQLSKDSNAVHAVRFSKKNEAIYSFSKKVDDLSNPSESFIAIMTCSSADKDCPVVFGAKKRYALTYDDPKIFDGTNMEEEKYLERSRQIGSEMLYLMQEVKDYMG